VPAEDGTGKAVVSPAASTLREEIDNKPNATG
jgi:hypothetical protein